MAQTGPISFKAPIKYGPAGEEIFRERKSLFFKSVKLRRIYDPQSNTLLYVAYSTNWSSGSADQADPNSRYRTSVAALPLFGAQVGQKPAC